TGLTNLVGSGSGNFRYNSNASSTGYNSTAAALGAGTYAVYREAPELGLTADSGSMTYGGTTPTLSYTVSGDQNGDTIAQIFASAPSVAIGGNSTAAGYVAGNHSVNLTTSAGLLGYNITVTNGNLVVGKIVLNTNGTTVVSRAYDGTVDATLTNTMASGILASDLSNVTLNLAGIFADKNVANNISVTSNISMTGSASDNYSFTQPISLTGDITPKTVTLSAAQAYSGSNTLTNVTVATGISGETLTYSAALANSANVVDNGSNYITSITLGSQAGANTTSGGLVSNYQLPTLNVSNAPVTISAANLTVAANNQTRAYGATNPSTGNVTITSGQLYNSDALSTATVTSAANATSNVGNYTLTASNQTMSTGLVGNYNITYAAGNLAVNPADLTITANSASTQYGLGTTLGNTAFTSSGLQNSETIGTVVLASAGSANTTNVGTYNITASGAANGSFTASNYNISYVNGSLVVTQANLTLKADDQARTYGAANPTAGNVTITSGQLYNSDALSTATVTSAANATSNVGNYTLTASNQTMSTGLVGNYNITYAAGNLAVNPADLTITANSASTQYGLGTTLGNTAFTSSGLQNSETIGTVVLASAGSANTTNVGTYNITASGAANGSFTASNYNISYVNGSLVVTQANITVVADDQSRTYGAANPTSGTVTLGGGGTLYNGDTLGNATVASTANATSNVGNYTLTASNQSFTSGLSSNYNITYNNGTLTVNKAEATVIANSVNVTYNGSQQSVSGFTATGLVNNQTVAVLTDVSAGANGTNAGVYVSQATGNATNYNLTFVDGALTIDKAALTVTGNTFNTTYTGQSQSVSGYNVSGLQGTDTAAVLTNVSASGANGTNAGSYTNSVTTGVETNYIVTGINGALNIAKAVITVSADNKARLYGDSNPSLTQAMTGFVVGEDAVIANITGSSAASTLATNLSGVGNYTITSGIGSLSAANYDFAAANGTLTINKAHLTVTADDQSRIYGAANPTFTQTITGFVNGETSSVVSGSAFGSSVANATTSVGNHTITAGLGGLSSANYDFVGANGTLTISKAQLSAIGNKVYDGSSLINGSQISVTGVNGETFTATGTAAMQSKNVQTNQSLSSIAGLALSGANGSSLSNYEDLVLPNTSVSVSRLNVTLVAPNATMVYGNTTIQQATTADLTALSGQLVGGDRVSSAAITYNTKDAGANKTVTLNSVVVSDDNGGQNYCVSVADSYNGVITKAPLIISAVNDGKILAQADTVAANGSIGYGGVVYTGFVGGETAANLTSTANGSVQALWNGTVTRSNISGVDNQSARTYSGVLTPSSFSATNYNITYRSGDYIIVPADTLLIKVVGSGTANVNYSSSLSSFQLSAEYVRSNTTISNLSANVTNGYASIVDGFGTTAIFRLNAVNGSYSSSGNLNVGGYNLNASNVTIIGSNFNNLAVVGAITVAPKTINNNVSTIQSVSKVYDGSTSITAANLSFNQTASGVVAGDHVSLIGSGSYTDRHVGANKSVTLSMGLFGNEFGNDSNNYVLSNASLTGNIGTITQLASVAYTGANNGNWSTATNWAGGALPDGNNVAQVIIPINKTVVYNSEQVGTTSSAIVNNGSIVFDSANAFNLANSISGTGSIVQRGAGILNITGNNSMSGVVDIANYRLSLGSQNALGNANITSTGGNLSVTGGTTLSRLSVDGAVTIDSVINTIGDQVYGGPLTFLTGNNSSTANFNSSAGNISFMSTVSAGAGSKSAQRNLVVTAANGTVLFNDQVGLDVVDRLSASYTLNPYTSSYSGLSGVNPYAMNVTAQTIKLFGDVTTFEGQEYNGSVLIGDNGSNGRTRLLLSMDPSVVVNGPINDVSAGQHTLLMRAFSLLANVGPAPTIRYGNVGNIAPLADLNALVGVQETNPALSPVVGQQAAGVPLFGSVTQTGTTTIYVAPLPQSSMGSNTASQNASMHGQLHDQTQQLVQSFKSSEMDSSASAGDVVVGDLTNASCDPKIDDFCSGK
ncbi:S-layer family protein, partial [Polynucleobacter sp. es-MAR-4]|uniref:beta strand repeat-containing protein n=1 Tax=Polynucleobacter sp. es-MAR-4 TaxID=1855655 RepID=UPI001C0D95DA